MSPLPLLLLFFATPLLATSPPKLNPVSRLHPARLGSKRNTPSYDITLHYAEKDYTHGEHYAATINWVMNEPAVVINDDPSIVSFTCAVAGESITWATDASYQEALDSWTLPMYAIVEDDEGGCQYFNDGDPTYDVYRLNTLLKRDDATRTLVFETDQFTWDMAASYHHINAGLAKRAIRLPGDHRSLMARAGNPRTEKLRFNINYDLVTDKAVAPLTFIDLAKKDQGPGETGLERAFVQCSNCYATARFDIVYNSGSVIVNAVINVIIEVAKLVGKIIKALADIARDAKDQFTKGPKWNAAVLSSQPQVYAFQKEIDAKLNELDKITRGSSSKKLKPRPIEPEDIEKFLSWLTKEYHRLYDYIKKVYTAYPQDAKSGFPTLRDRYLNSLTTMYSLTRDEVKDAAAKGGIRIDRRDGLPASPFAIWTPPVVQRISLTGTPLTRRHSSTHDALVKRAGRIVRRQQQVTNPALPKNYLHLKGGINAMLDLSVDLKGRGERQLGQKTLAEKKLGGFEIPKIIKIGPKIDLLGIIKFIYEGSFTTRTGGSLKWQNIDFVFDLEKNIGEQAKSLPPAIFDKIDPDVKNFHNTQITLGIGLSLEPRVLFEIEFTLISTKAALRAGVGARAGLDFLATIREASPIAQNR
ncbi:hypothetical protein T439DRAFT_85573 [Meredithblackwellia eburnea MCA 4105]